MSAIRGGARRKAVLDDTHVALLSGNRGVDTHMAVLDGENTRMAALAGANTRTASLGGMNMQTAALSGNPRMDTRVARRGGGVTDDTHYAELEGEPAGYATGGTVRSSASGLTPISNRAVRQGASYEFSGSAWVDIATFSRMVDADTEAHIIRFYVQIANMSGLGRAMSYRIVHESGPSQPVLSTGTFSILLYRVHAGLFTAVDNDVDAASSPAVYTLQFRSDAVAGTLAFSLLTCRRRYEISKVVLDDTDTHAAMLIGDGGVDTHEAVLRGTTAAGLAPMLRGVGPVDTHVAALEGATGADAGLSEAGTTMESVEPPDFVPMSPQYVWVSGIQPVTVLTAVIPAAPDGRDTRSLSGAIMLNFVNTALREYTVTVTRQPDDVQVAFEAITIPSSRHTELHIMHFADTMPVPNPPGTQSYRVDMTGTFDNVCVSVAIDVIVLETVSPDTHAAALRGSGRVDTHIALMDGGITEDTHAAMIEGEDTHYAMVSGTDTHHAIVEGSDGRFAELEGEEGTDTHAASLDGAVRGHGSSSGALAGIDQ